MNQVRITHSREFQLVPSIRLTMDKGIMVVEVGLEILDPYAWR